MPKKPTLKGRARGSHSTIAEVAEPLVKIATRLPNVGVAPSLIQSKRGGKIRSLTLTRTPFGIEARVIGPHTVQLVNLFVEPAEIESVLNTLTKKLTSSFDRVSIR